MTKLLILNNSMRSKRASDNLVDYVQSIANTIEDIDVSVADLRELDIDRKSVV